MGLIYRGNGEFVDEHPVDLEKILPKEWSPALKGVEMYWMVEFPSPYRTAEVLILTKKGPKGKILEQINVHSSEWEESMAPLTDTEEAISMYQKDKKYAFEEFPYVDLETEEQYIRAIENERLGPKDWSPKQKKKSEMWQGPGIYDFRDHPPTRSYKNLDVYETSGMEERARQVLESTYDGDYKEPMRKLIKHYSDYVESEAGE